VRAQLLGVDKINSLVGKNPCRGLIPLVSLLMVGMVAAMKGSKTSLSSESLARP
jgi:hypothetical protein